jgi:sulfane dehydrogenase subunit SoxC
MVQERMGAGPEAGMAGPVEEPITFEELQLAVRNHSMPLEALSHDVTPIGMHYLLTHFDIPLVDVASWRLAVEGLVARPLSLSLEELRRREAVTLTMTFECAGNGRGRLSPRPRSQPWLGEAVGTGEWSGIPLRALLEEAEPAGEAIEVVFTGVDHGVEGGVEQDYQRSLSLEDAMLDDVLLAYELNGLPIPPQHGFPLRLVVPGWYGMANVKWLRGITVSDQPFTGFMQAQAYRFRQDPDDSGTPVTRMLPRALMRPPGMPEFLSRSRIVRMEPFILDGRAWSGWGPIESVEVSADGRATWQPAEVESPRSPAVWQRWTYEWKPTAPGLYELSCRARDSAGNVQPLEQSWNVGGYANNSVQRISVRVLGPGETAS